MSLFQFLVVTFLPAGLSTDPGEMLLPFCVAHRGDIVTVFHNSHHEPDSDLEETFFLVPAGKLISLKCAEVWIICPWTQQICSQQAAPVSTREQSVMPDDV